MTGDFFDRLEADLADLTHRGAHIGGATARTRYYATLIKRTAVAVLLSAALAVSLSSEFPASANGHAVSAQISMSSGL